jgi:predicted dehydrogenase
MDTVRIGLIGYGGMGRSHASYLTKGDVPGARLAAVCDAFPSALESAKAAYGDDVKYFDDPETMMKSGEVDGILITTPHYEHPKMAMLGFKHGMHVLTEKPAGVYTKQVREMNDAAEKSDKVFGIMFNQRMSPAHQKMKSIVETGELGEIRRINYVITNWFRTQAYYDSGGWRATWGGEGGGVLINQCPHNLDLWQWVCGMPKRMRAFCEFGKYHNIEVEDSVTAYAEYENGATAVFISTTGEAPGSNSWEIVGDRGSLKLEGGKLTFRRTVESVSKFLQESKGAFSTPETWTIDIPINGKDEGHMGVTKDWVRAIREGTPLYIPGQEGINGLMLSNSMLLSTWTDDWVNLPIDEDKFLSELEKRIKNSTFKKPETESKAVNFAGSF